MNGTRAVRVTQVRWEAEGVVSLRLAATGGTPLPAWSAGAHIDLVLPSGVVRQYSLCGERADPDYTIAVLREATGRGGSAEVHDTALVGRELQIRGPRNHFELEPAPAYVFVAGGIGITPVLAMVRAAVAVGAPWELHYGGRRTGTLAFTATAAELAERSGGRLATRSDDAEGPLPLGDIVANAPDGAALYACGPPGMLTALTDVVSRQRPGITLRFERFTAAPAGAGAAAVQDAGREGGFEVELARTGGTVRVEPGESILDAVRTVRPETMSSCEEGFCGTCETKVLDGEPIHRDTILTAKERARSTSMMICVGGCASRRLVLDL